MASPAYNVAPSGGESKSLLGLGVAFGIHTVVVYGSALHLSQMLVFHWFGWVVPLFKISISIPATDWYLQHLEVMAIAPALVLGYLNVTRLFPHLIRSYIGEDLRSDSVGLWVWIVPALVLGFKMLLYHSSSSVLSSAPVSAIKYFFDIQKVMPTMNDPLASDPIRVWAQMTVTTPFYAGIAYSLGALALKHRLLSKLFTSQKHEQSAKAPES